MDLRDAPRYVAAARPANVPFMNFSWTRLRGSGSSDLLPSPRSSLPPTRKRKRGVAPTVPAAPEARNRAASEPGFMHAFAAAIAPIGVTQPLLNHETLRLDPRSNKRWVEQASASGLLLL
jgi:hypothetical protein